MDLKKKKKLFRSLIRKQTVDVANRVCKCLTSGDASLSSNRPESVGIQSSQNGAEVKPVVAIKKPIIASRKMETTPEVLDCLCVPQYGKDMDERAVLFLKIREGYSFNQDLVSRVKKIIEKNCSFKHVPEVVLEVKDIPVRINQSHVLQKLGIFLNKE
ncbi:acetoacetyl-CoA synthetase [Trichonephila clavipes]|nr:acetoacetyl-CoA synthetase [Trichonephila clavipes]